MALITPLAMESVPPSFKANMKTKVTHKSSGHSIYIGVYLDTIYLGTCFDRLAGPPMVLTSEPSNQ
jgi:hypothetical protein